MRNRQRARFQGESVGAEVIQLSQLPEHDRHFIATLPVLDERDEIELRVIKSNGVIQSVHLPVRAERMVRALLNDLSREKRVVLISEGRSLSCRSGLA